MADWNCNLCKEYQSGIACTYCDDGSEFAKMSNADRIRAMNDEELAEFLEGTNRDYDISYGDYFSTKAGDFIFSKKDLSKEILKWLQSEAE